MSLHSIGGRDNRGYATRGCKCAECEQWRGERRRKDKLRKLGRGYNTTPQEFAQVVARVRELRAQGMSYDLISQAAGYAQSAVHRLANGELTKIRRDKYEAIMAVEWSPTELAGLRRERNGGTLIDHTGTRRRCAALFARGFPYSWQARQLGHRSQVIDDLMRTARPLIAYQTYMEIKDLYDKWQDRDPVTDAAIDQRVVTRTLRAAARKGLAPPACWDEDTIDDPAAQPAWGAVGAVVLDEVAIERALSGVPTELTRAERREVLRRLAACVRQDPAAVTRETGPDKRYVNAAAGLGLAEKSVRTEVGRISRKDAHGSEEEDAGP